MTKAEYLFLRRAEIPKTLRLLEMFPEEKRDVRPSETSRSALDLAITFLMEDRIGMDLIQGRPVTAKARENVPGTIKEIVMQLREASQALDNAVEALDEPAFNRTVSFYGLTLALGAALTIELLDHIHHRGQFTIYSRMAGARVPQIYGPSRDEP